MHGEGTADRSALLMDPNAWQWADLGRDSAREAGSVEGMESYDDRMTMRQLREWNRQEKVIADESGDCLFEALSESDSSFAGGKGMMRAAVVGHALATGRVSANEAAEMMKPGVWGTDVEIQATAEMLNIEVAVAIMRPKGDELRIRTFMPGAIGARTGRIVITFRPGHFNATVSDVSLNNRARRKVWSAVRTLSLQKSDVRG